MSEINNKIDNNFICPWMIELWAWADEFEISEADLPRNKNDLLAMTKLDISSNQITRLPECIVNLKNLRYLTFGEDKPTDSASSLVNISTGVAEFLRDLGDSCVGWNDPTKANRSISIQDYIQRQKSLINEGIIASKNVDRAALQTVLDWAESFAVSNIQTDIDKLANQNALSIDSYTQPIPAAIGYLTQLKSLILRDSISSNGRVCQADDKLPDSIINLVNLETLSLVCKDAVFIPANLYELKNLKTLEITFHDVNAIPNVLTAMNCDIRLLIHSKQDRLPDNLVDISSLTELSIYNDYLTELPESIGKLHNLKQLTVTSSHLKKILQNIGDLINLTHLRLNCKNLKYLPDSSEQLTSLCGLNIPNQLTNQLPMNLIKRYRDNELWITNISSTTLYKPLADNYRLSTFGFFLVNDDWDESKLIDLKQKTAAEFLFGLQTTEKTIKQFDVVDGIVICKPNEVQQVMKMFESIFCSLTTGLDYDDVKEALHFKKPAKFVHDGALNEYQSDQVFNQIISQIPKANNLKSLMFHVECHRYLSLDELDVIHTAIKNLGIEDCNIFYGAERVDNPGYCWMGIIYMVD
ncbi:leucine-rich repeat domain-containing protein [Psychrobacter sp.]|uniref:leucine-rich repeat domain-containing protein n=1 Tax=Psychrobacter sp. TaxID=56811 RepID=UPI003BAF7E9B